MKNAAILVVDDYQLVRRALGRALESVGYTVYLAASGEEALGILREHQMDAVVLDLHMPVMSGQTLFHVIIGKWPALKAKVLIMTGDQRAEEKETWLKLYDLPVVKKPFALGEVVTLIDVLTADEPREANGS
jgi:two-component system cell cycle sensor histidine kinase/response regulator CckA